MFSVIALHVLLILFLMVCSAFFSGSETAYFSINRMRIQRLSYEGNEKAEGIVKLLKKPRNLLLSILFGNELVNVSVSAVATALWIIILGPNYGPVVAFTSMLILLVLFCEITPKSYAINNPDKFCHVTVNIMRVWFNLLHPIRVILIKLYEFLFKILRIEYKEDDDLFSSDDFLYWLESNKDEEILDKDEYELIYQALDLKNKKVKDVMTPRTDIFAFDIKEPTKDKITKVKSRQYARIPVYDGDLDHIVGILYTKDILAIKFPESRKNLRNMLHKVEYVSGYMKLNELLVYFMRRRIHIALVTDEYGGVDGLVSFEDILEELVGEIQDEFDSEEPIFTLLEDNKYRISALMRIDDFNEKFKTTIENINYDTLGGFLLDKFGRIPEDDEKITVGNIMFKVLQVRNNRIISVEVSKKDGAIE